MAKFAVINSKDFFDKRNNPSGRLDASYGIALSQMLKGDEDPDPKSTIQAIFKDDAGFKSWLRGLRKLTRIKDVENHISLAFLGRCSWETWEGKKDETPEDRKTRLARNAETAQKAKFSPPVMNGIRQMARKICAQEAKAIECTIAEDLLRIDTLRKLSEKE
jgi:hypothetical protein